MPTCKKCGANILFVETPNGKRMPVDADNLAGVTPEDLGLPDSRVVVVVRGFKAGYTLVAGPGEDLVRFYRPHWASCTDPDHFRKE